MKSSRIVLVLVMITVAGLLVWRFMPGSRQRVKGAASKFGGWTEAARKEDPVGFITYAERKLSQHLQRMQDVRRSLAEGRVQIKEEQDRVSALQHTASNLLSECRGGYDTAESSDTYPVSVAGRAYDRDALLEQVRLAMVQRNSYVEILRDLAKAEAAAENKEQAVIVQSGNTRAALATMSSKKEIARVNKLTGQIAGLLSQVDALIGLNEKVLQESPVRTIEEISMAVSPDPDQSLSIEDALSFLKGRP